MSQHDFVLDNQSGASFRADINAALLAIETCSSGNSAPSVTYPFQFWADTANGLLKQRDAANTTWLPVLTLATGAPVALAAGAVLGAISGGSLGPFAHRNKLLNGSFAVNSRGYASGAVLAAGSFGHDRWKAGASGGDYTFTQNASTTTITIGSGKTLIQVVDAALVGDTSYVLSWTGTAQARYAVNSATPAGSYAASPILITGQTVGSTMSVEFNSGTLGKVQLEPGAVVTPFEPRAYALDLYLCQGGGNVYAGLKSVSGVATLDGSYAGAQIVLSGTSYTVTLPAASSFSAGATLNVFTVASGTVTLSRAGSDTIVTSQGTPATSLGLSGGDTLTLVSNGVNAWQAVGGSAQLPYAPEFAATLGSSGWQKLPSGLIVQWGSSSVGAGSNLGITFPMAFPNACYVVLPVGQYSSALNTAYAASATSLSTSGCTLNNWSSTTSLTILWIAIGK